VQAPRAATASGIEVAEAEDQTLHVIDVSSQTPTGEPIAAGVSFDVAPRERALLSGPSGCGKTTLLRAIAGIWPYGRGRIERPPVPPLFLSQRPYLPLGSLRDALCYPQVSTDVEDARVRSALADVGLDRLAPRLDDIADWSHILSLGEQQRIAFARVLVTAPKLLVLDEATSGLDAPAERHMYELVRERLPDAIVLSVGHRDTLEALHDRKIPFPVA
jgi:vitamin B12/bleomycin/antimicrobial peptide transport system ATP-binding/permease protein